MSAALDEQQLIICFSVPTLPHEHSPLPCPRMSCFLLGVNCIPALDFTKNLANPSDNGALQSRKKKLETPVSKHVIKFLVLNLE
jgi:hypothetical protein